MTKEKFLKEFIREYAFISIDGIMYRPSKQYLQERGESLWKTLSNEFKVGKAEISLWGRDITNDNVGFTAKSRITIRFKDDGETNYYNYSFDSEYHIHFVRTKNYLRCSFKDGNYHWFKNDTWSSETLQQEKKDLGLA